MTTTVPGPAPDGRRVKQLGRALVDDGLITEDQLATALAAARREGGLLGRHILLHTPITRRQMYGALAAQWDAPLVDLVSDPPDPDLLTGLERDVWTDLGWLPWRLTDGTLTVATAVPPTPALTAEAADRFGASTVHFRTTTDWDINQTVQRSFRARLLYDSAERLATEKPHESARVALTRWQSLLPAALVLLLVALFVWDVRTAVIVLLTVANAVFLVNIGFKTLASLRQPWDVWQSRRWRTAVDAERARRGLPKETGVRVPDDELPVYTILVPVFREANIVQKLLTNLGALDYPKSRLDVLVLLEEDDVETIAAAKASAPPEYVRILVVPRGDPQTKPRACNYGLTFARGEFVVIYDAEDRPDPDQLRVAIDAFRFAERQRATVDPGAKPLICVQASLNYFNAEQNVLTRMFAVEYSHWFDSMLPGLEASHIPLPLGGTSNHFRTEELRALGAWDPWNVTEDADLGLRASVEGFRVGVIDSTTWEEACSQVPAWIRQRTRWIKGYMITSAVNTRNAVRFVRHTGVMGAVGFVGLILGTPLAFLAYPLVLGFTVVTYVGVRFIGLYLPEWLVQGGVVSMLFGNAMMIVVSGIAAWRRYNWRVAIFALLNPAYWVLHSVAAWRAAWQMLTTPHRWEKTPHGLDEEEWDTA
ncbi:glycosyl transferase [Tersicoccus solisilvae]|uniref:Glycosyl transferase n=1 Tax=Tersicoccus solisilvae TaxID=1882339 RepID=A0ABQ1PEH3_9MICC|nr:glycosyltransferase [Tersicoccus solisilvae]GGC95670.1 glycosyl transferase [Tersicoccus solisilvae]